MTKRINAVCKLREMGYSFDEKKVLNCKNLHKSKIELTDEEGYKYCVQIGNTLKGCPPAKYHKNNPYSIYNINNYIKLKNIHLEVLENEYFHSGKKMKFRCKCGDIFEMNLERLVYYTPNKTMCKKCSIAADRLKRKNTLNKVKNNTCKNALLVI